MKPTDIDANETDTILALQLTVAWAGEGLSDPARLDWWRTDLVDEAGGGDLLGRLFPKTHRWASLELVRNAAVQADTQARLSMAKPDRIRTLFFWGFEVDEKIRERLAFHKKSMKPPNDALKFPIDMAAAFNRSGLESAFRIPDRDIRWKVSPGGRELTEPIPDSPALCARHLAAALLPFSDKYPAPFFRMGESP